MLKVGNKIRFGHQIFIVECIKNNNILLNNNNILNWFSFDDIKKIVKKFNLINLKIYQNLLKILMKMLKIH